MINRTTLEKTMAVLNAEKEAQETICNANSNYLRTMKCGELFTVKDVERRYWTGGDDKRQYRVSFTADPNHGWSSDHHSFEVDQDFNASSISWGSWSHTNIKPEEQDAIIEKCAAYVAEIREHLGLLTTSHAILREAVITAIQFYEEVMMPDTRKLIDTQNAIDEVQKAIKQIEIDESTRDARGYFELGKVYAMVKSYDYSRNVNFYQFELAQRKDALYIKNGRHNAKKLSDGQLLELYRQYTRTLTNYDSEWSSETGERVYTYKKRPNASTVVLGANSTEQMKIVEQEWEVISKEEYEQIKQAQR